MVGNYDNTRKYNSIKRGSVHYSKAQYSTGYYKCLTYSKGLYCIELDALVRINTEMCGKTITRYDIINNNLILQKYC